MNTYINKSLGFKYSRILIICLGSLLLLSSHFTAQDSIFLDSNFTENTTEQDKFSMYLDTIDKYCYRDFNIAIAAQEKCDQIIANGTVLNDSTLLNYVIQQIYLKYNQVDVLGAYQLIVDNEYLLESDAIPKELEGSFKYLTSFTLMSIGDLEAAQEAYYQTIERGMADKDTASIIGPLHSLGQLYLDNEEYEEGLDCFNRIIEYRKTVEMRPTTIALTYMEKAEGLTALELYDEALESLDTAYVIMDKNDIEVLKSDVLINKGNIYISQGKIKSAEGIYQELLSANQGTQDPNNLAISKIFLATLYQAKKMYPQALEVFKEILMETDSTNLDRIVDLNYDAHVVSKEMKDYETALGFLRAHNEMNHKREEDVKRQKTEYLKIKFNSEQKEKDNAILAAQISENQAERIVLYFWSAISVLLLAFLIGAFYQKKRYSKRLEEEVHKRTLSLKKANILLNNSVEELDEFNRILSHDLKEPLRGIVGFSQLASRDIDDKEKTQKYLDYVSKNGHQLGELIDDVSTYRNIDSIKNEGETNVSIKALLDEISLEVKSEFPHKEISIELNAEKTIYCSLGIVKGIFRRIIDNAARFNKNSKVYIKVDYNLENGAHVFDFEDNGIGIPENYHTQVFKMFKRLNNRELFSGSGLGLSIVDKLIKKIGGKISIVRSEENVGTTFRVTLGA